MEKYNLKFIFVLCLIFSVFQSCFKSQSNHQYQTVPTSLVSKYWKVSSQKVKGYYDLTKALPKNYSVKGNVNYTQYLQKAIDGYDKVMMPNFPVLINKNGLKLKSNQTVYFPKNAWLIFQGPAVKKLDDVLKIYNVENVVLINPQIEGSKFARIQQEGQWSAGICILNSKNIKTRETALVQRDDYQKRSSLAIRRPVERQCFDLKKGRSFREHCLPTLFN